MTSSEVTSSPAPALGHKAVIRPRVRRAPELLDSALYARLRQSSSEDVSDAVGRLYTMDGGIRPLYEPIRRIAGPAITVRLPPGDNWGLAAALRDARPGEVLVVDWMGYRDGCGSGVNSLVPAIRQGLAGVVIDGCWRDVDELQVLDFPVFGRGISPYSPPKAQPGEINVPVSCGGVIVEPGDVVVADSGGVAVVPRQDVDRVVEALPEEPTPLRTSLDDYPPARSYERRVAAYFDRFGDAS